MADNTIMQTKYAREFIQSYQQEQSWLRGTVTTEGAVNGDKFVFIISGVVAPAVKRGSNGLIPYGQDGQNSSTVTLEEYFGQPQRKNNFNILASSAPQRQQMQRDSVKSINFTTDQMIIDQLTLATVTTGAAAALTISQMLKAVALLTDQSVATDGEIYGILPANSFQNAMKINQFSSGDWVSDKPFMNITQWRKWNNVKWACHPNLPGKNTAAAVGFVYHKAALGHGINDGDFKTVVGFNDEHDYSYAYSRSYQGAKLLQNNGIVKINLDDQLSTV
jgi:hypothetical protein